MTARRILRLKEVIEKTGMGRDFIYRGDREGWFPHRVKLGQRAAGWIEAEVDAWLEARAAERGYRDACQVPTQAAPRKAG